MYHYLLLWAWSWIFYLGLEDSIKFFSLNHSRNPKHYVVFCAQWTNPTPIKPFEIEDMVQVAIAVLASSMPDSRLTAVYTIWYGNEILLSERKLSHEPLCCSPAIKYQIQGCVILKLILQYLLEGWTYKISHVYQSP